MQLPGDRVFRTDGIPPGDRFAYWQEVLATALGSRTISRPDPQRFYGRLTLNHIDRLSLVHGLCASLSVSRTVSNIASLTSESLHWICPIQGRVVIHQAGRSAMLAAGDSGFVMSSEPFTLNYLDNVNAMTLDIPTERLATENVAFGDLSAINLTQRVQSSAALAALLQSLPKSHLRGETNANRQLANLTVDMVNVLLEEFLREKPRDAEGTPGDAERVRHYIEASLKDPLLSPRRAAIALGLSERSLHKAMAATGVTFMEHLRSCRIDRIAAALRAHGQIASGMASVGLTDLVFEWGFNDLSTFYRAFRSRLDCTPTEFLKRYLT